MTTPIYIIYKITCIITDKSYIGQTQFSFHKRWQRHINQSNRNSLYYFHNAIRKYGKDNFTHEILFETTNQNIINDAEIDMIAMYDTYHNGYNLTIGGDGQRGFIHSEKSKLKMSQSHSGKKLSTSHKENISKVTSGKNNPNYGNCGKNNSRYKGDYITPLGKFYNTKIASKSFNYLISGNTIRRWCKNPDIIINNRMICQSPYLKSPKKSPLGKTFREIGFWFIPKL